MKRLNYATLSEQNYSGYLLQDAPEKILQFGEGNFLRGFVDDFFDILNEKGLFHGKCVVVQPLAQGLGSVINAQQGLYSLYLRGTGSGGPETTKRVISVISRVIDPYMEKASFYSCAANPDLRIIVSNTTEAGIAFHPEDRFDDMDASFPAKLTNFLWQRYVCFGKEVGKGCLILSCELIDNNGKVLKDYVVRYARLWKLPEEFISWIARENTFCSTLVDRIITGYPRTEAVRMNEESGYEDAVIDTGEPFAFWAIEGPEWMKAELPFEQAGLPVRIVPDQSGYKKRKVRILNGAQTATTLGAYLAGLELERDYMNDDLFYPFIRSIMFDEVLPATDLDPDDMKAFASTCLERLANPFIDHRLFDITLNSVPKWRARILPTIKDYYKKFGAYPQRLTFSLATLLAFYRCTERNGHFYGTVDGHEYEVRDDTATMRFFAEASRMPADAYVNAYLQAKQFHDTDFQTLPGFGEQVAAYLNSVEQNGIRETIRQIKQ